MIKNTIYFNNVICKITPLRTKSRWESGNIFEYYTLSQTSDMVNDLSKATCYVKQPGMLFSFSLSFPWKISLQIVYTNGPVCDKWRQVLTFLRRSVDKAHPQIADSSLLIKQESVFSLSIFRVGWNQE